jgi:hypothetical protein
LNAGSTRMKNNRRGIERIKQALCGSAVKVY